MAPKKKDGDVDKENPFAEPLKRLRGSHYGGAGYLAEVLGVSKATVYSWSKVASKVAPSLENLIRLAILDASSTKGSIDELIEFWLGLRGWSASDSGVQEKIDWIKSHVAPAINGGTARWTLLLKHILELQYSGAVLVIEQSGQQPRELRIVVQQPGGPIVTQGSSDSSRELELWVI